MKSISFEEFEKAALYKLMEEDTSVNLILREQYKQAKVISRNFTGVGFFTDFHVAENAPRIIENVPYGYGNPSAIINDIYGYGFVLFIKEGVMICFEGYTWTNSWPEIITSYSFVE